MQNQLFTPPPQQSALVTIESSRAVQEVQAALIIAKKFPRDQLAALERIKNACQRPSLANVSIYQYARGGTDITGPSIRLAEAIALEWGNISTGWRIINQTDASSTVEAFAWDQETNTRRSMTFEVPHERHTSKGVKKLTDPRDIYELCANNAARRLRACILATVPGDIVEEAMAQCDITMKAKADTSPQAVAKMIEAFGSFGVTKGQVEKRIQRKLDAITAAQVVALRKIYQSLKDGMSRPDEWFEVEVKAATVPASKVATVDASFTLSPDAPSVREELQGRMSAAELDFQEVAEMGFQIGLNIDAQIQFAEQPEDALRDVLGAWDAITAQLKGGAR